MVTSEISVRELAALGPDAHVIDVREHYEWDGGHISTAVHVPMASVPDHLELFVERTTYVICHSGGRSLRVCEYVAGHGHEVVNVAGGMMAWAAAGYDVVLGS
jgi:rhodanese-related sulfurtransferase